MILIFEDAAAEELPPSADCYASAAIDTAFFKAKSAAAGTSDKFILISGGATAMTTSSSTAASATSFYSCYSYCPAASSTATAITGN